MGPSDPIIKLADKSGIELHCRQKCDEVEDPLPRLTFAKRSEDLDAALRSTAQVGGGTAWYWSREEAFESVDLLCQTVMAKGSPGTEVHRDPHYPDQ